MLSTIKKAKGQPVDYPEMLHVGFFATDQEKVDSSYASLAHYGIAMDMRPRPMRGRYGFYAEVLDGLLLEISAPADKS